MTKCKVHTDFFNDSCNVCKQEYLEMMSSNEEGDQPHKKYKQFTEERAKNLYEQLMLQFMKSGASEADSDRKAKAIIRKQCNIRGMKLWPWI